MKLILLIAFIINGQTEGPWIWAHEDTRQPFIYETQEACDAVAQQGAEEWIAAEKRDHKTNNVEMKWSCQDQELPGTPI